MTQYFNRKSEKETRRRLRKDQTPVEIIVWQYLRDRKFLHLKFRRQYSINKYVIEFYSAKLKLAVELDGNIHDEIEVKEHDEDRQEYIERNFGVTFVRISNDEIYSNSKLVSEEIEQAIKDFILSNSTSQGKGSNT